MIQQLNAKFNCMFLSINKTTIDFIIIGVIEVIISFIAIAIIEPFIVSFF